MALVPMSMWGLNDDMTAADLRAEALQALRKFPDALIHGFRGLHSSHSDLKWQLHGGDSASPMERRLVPDVSKCAYGAS
jgi:hypothetical protein